MMKALTLALALALSGPGLVFTSAQAQQPTLKDIAYANDDESQRLDVYQADSEKPTPVMVYIHGGGWRAGTKDKIPAFLAEAVSEGWLSVVSVEYRFTDVAIHPAQVNDCSRAIQYARSKSKQWNLDPARFGVTGGSAGAHLSLWIALHDDVADPDAVDPVARQSSRVSCAVGFAGPTDWNLLSQIPHGHPAYRQLLGYEPGTPAEEMAAKKKSHVSPITFVSADDPPILIVHGDADNIVPVQHALDLDSQAKAAGADTELLIVKDAGHNVAGAGGQAVIDRSTAFVREHLLGKPAAGMGIMTGEVTASSALIQVRLTQGDKLVERDLPGLAGVVEFVLREKGVSEGKSQVIPALAENDFVARAAFENLKPGTEYRCMTRIGPDKASLAEGPVATFSTLPGAEKAQPVRLVVVTGMNYAKFHGDERIDQAQHLLENNTKLPEPYAGPDKDLGYPALEAILEAKPDLFVGTGDNVYYDTPDNPRAETITELRQKWHEQFVQPRYRDLFAAVPTYWMIDDHDYRIDDGDNSGDYEPTPEVGRQMMLEQLPVAPAGDTDAKTYRTHRVSRDLQVWFPENRMYRDDNALPDGPDKSIWGEEQKAWLKRTLSESDATFKLLVSPTPMVGPDDLRKTDNHTNHGGFRHERDEFFAWLKASGLDQKHFYIVCGDRHWQYHAIHPSGIEEFSCGALIDSNSRLGRKPGDPESTDPEGLIRQAYTQQERSGGFLVIEVSPAVGDAPAQLKFSWRDEHGEELHATVK